MIDIVHVRPRWVPTGSLDPDIAKLFKNGERLRIPPSRFPSESLPSGHSVFRDSTTDVPAGAPFCCRVAMGDPGAVWTAVDSQAKDWGCEVVTYDILMVPDPDNVCPVCLVREVIES